ncbi:MAG: response regulator [Bacteroidia bacterium]|nr:response regulator [Bacteroidia bacterium]
MKLLVVDDEQDIELLFRQRLRRLLKEGLIEIKFAFSGEEAINYLNELEQPDIALILSDINMPGMSGFELLQRVKAKFPDLKVMMITAYGDDEHQAKARSLGADDFLSKPLDFKDLEVRLQQYLR